MGGGGFSLRRWQVQICETDVPCQALRRHDMDPRCALLVKIRKVPYTGPFTKGSREARSYVFVCFGLHKTSSILGG